MTTRSRLGRWALDTLERALSTFAQATLAALPTAYLPGVTIPFWAAFAAGGFAAGLAVLKCLAALGVGAPDSASLLPAEEDPPQEGAVDIGTALICVVLVILVLAILGLFPR